MAKSLLKNDGRILALVKPQFEAGKKKVGKKGIVREKEVHIDVLKEIVDFTSSINLGVKDLSFSPITGSKGNIEFLLYLDNNSFNTIDQSLVYKVVEKGHNTLK